MSVGVGGWLWQDRDKDRASIVDVCGWMGLGVVGGSGRVDVMGVGRWVGWGVRGLGERVARWLVGRVGEWRWEWGWGPSCMTVRSVRHSMHWARRLKLVLIKDILKSTKNLENNNQNH